MMNSIVFQIVRSKIVSGLAVRLLRIRLWRKWRIRRYLKNTTEPKLQIGCGQNSQEGWLNTGISLRESWEGVYLDAGKPFPLPDATFDYVYSEHLFEHLTYPQAINMLNESFRILKPDGIFRVATPDLQFLLRLYEEPDKPIHQSYIDYSAKSGNLPALPVFVINRFHTTWGHQIVYDKATLTMMLEKTGFRYRIM